MAAESSETVALLGLGTSIGSVHHQAGHHNVATINNGDNPVYEFNMPVTLDAGATLTTNCIDSGAGNGDLTLKREGTDVVVHGATGSDFKRRKLNNVTEVVSDPADTLKLSAGGSSVDVSVAGTQLLNIAGSQMTYGGDHPSNFTVACQARAGQEALLITETAPGGADRLRVGSIGTYNIIDSQAALTVSSAANGIVMAAKGGGAVNIQGQQVVRFGVNDPNTNVGEFNANGLALFAGYQASVPQDPTSANHLCRKSYVDSLGTNLPLLKITGSTYGTIQEMQNVFHSSGVVDGLDVTPNGVTPTNVDIASGNFLIRSSDSITADLYHGTYSGATNQTIPAADTLYYVTLTWVNDTTEPSLSFETSFGNNTNSVVVGVVYHESGVGLHITDEHVHKVSDHASRMIDRLLSINPVLRTSGLGIGTSGLQITVSAGTVWTGLSKVQIMAFDSAVTDFAYYYRASPSGWVRTVNGEINNTQYDDGTGTLATLGNGRYGVHWVFMGVDGDAYVIYGRDSYTLADAETASVPADIPPHFEKHALLVAKLIIAKSNTVIDEVFSAFTSPLTFASANTASGVSYDNTTSGLAATDTQAAIDEVVSNAATLADKITKNDTTVTVVDTGSNSYVNYNIDGVNCFDVADNGTQAVFNAATDRGFRFTTNGTGTMNFYSPGLALSMATDINCSKNFNPSGTVDLGVDGARWNKLWCVNADGTFAYFVSSDARVKTDVKTLTDGLSLIKALRPVQYRHVKNTSRRNMGFIAQEVEEVVGKDSGAISIRDDGTYSMAYSELIAPLASAVQELSKRVETLESR